MAKFIIQGGTKVHGTIAVTGAKNHALKVFAASILSEEPMTITNVPEIEDIFRITEILEDLGVTISHPHRNKYVIDTSTITKRQLPKKLVPKLRASIVLTGPMLARFGKVIFPHPGGCAIGRRPIDLFIAGYKAMGAKYEEKNGVNIFTAPNGLKGARFVFPTVSVTCTETLMMAATLAKGKTTLVNAAREPEIQALAEYLNMQGARIEGAGTNEIVIEGVERLSAGVCEIIPDRIEVLSFLYLALAAKSKLTITACNPEHIETPLQLLKDAGAKLDIKETSITTHPWKTMKPIKVVTREYPGFPTDGQSPLTVLLTQIPGESEVEETIYSNRLFYTDMLNRMGAEVDMHTPQHITVHGGTPLRAKVVESPDLRAGIAMVIAAVIAKGTSEINNIYQIDRGYEQIDKRLRSIGVNIKRAKV